MQRGQSNGCASCDSIPPTFETIRIIPNVAARPAADVTRCFARVSAHDEMSTLIEPSHLHHDSYYGSAKASAVAAPEVGRQREPYWSAVEREVIRLRQLRHEFCGHVTCIMIVTDIRFSICNAKASTRCPVLLLAASSGSASGGAF